MNKLQIQNNMKFIEKHIDFTLVSKLYKNGIVGTTRDKKIIYLEIKGLIRVFFKESKPAGEV